MGNKSKLIKGMSIDSFGSSKLSKRIFIFAIFAFYFIFSTIILFKYISIPNNIKQATKNVWIIPVIFIVWDALKISNCNLHISYNSSRYSFFLSIFVAIYIIIFFFWIDSLKINKIIDVLLLTMWIVSLKVFSMIWSFLFILSERKTRPFFIKVQIISMICQLLNIIFILIVTYYLVPKINVKDFSFHFFIEFFNWLKQGYKNKEILVIFTSTLLVLILITNIALMLWILSYRFKNDLLIIRINRILCLYNSIIKLGPIVIWFLASITIEHFEFKEFIFIFIIYTMAILTFVVSLTRKESGGASKIFLLFSTTSLFIIFFLLFGMVVWTNMNLFYGLSFALPAILFITVLNALIEPELPTTYGTVYNILMNVLSIYIIGVWVLKLFLPIFNDALPFEIQEILLILPLVCILYMESVVIYSNWYTFKVISKKSLLIYEYQSGKKKIKKRFIKKGVYDA